MEQAFGEEVRWECDSLLSKGPQKHELTVGAIKGYEAALDAAILIEI